MKWLAVGCFAILLGACSKSGKTEAGLSLFEKQNLIAWCIVPFDVKERSPEERAAMLERLGLKRVAYDWRQTRSEFEQEILAYKKHGLEYFAFWGEHPAAFALFEKYGLHPQIWKMLPSPKADTEEARVEEVARSLLPLVEQTAAMGCKLGIYNHGGWQGEPDNMIAIVEWLRKNHGADHVGIIYNLHHGHEQIQHFAENLKKMMPYLLCLNIDGVNASGEPMILPVGQGDTDKAWIQTIVESGYRGPIGILGHVADRDVEIVLQENLDGLQALTATLAENKFSGQ